MSVIRYSVWLTAEPASAFGEDEVRRHPKIAVAADHACHGFVI
jgi:hypothetical protein